MVVFGAMPNERHIAASPAIWVNSAGWTVAALSAARKMFVEKVIQR